MRNAQFAVLGVIALIAATQPVAAQEVRSAEVIPYIAVGTAGASPVGVAVLHPVSTHFSIETDAAYRSGEGDIHALSANTSLLWLLPRVGRATPYAAAGIGVSQYGAPVLSANGPPIGTDRRVAMTVNVGGGLHMPLNDRLGWRTDVRWFRSVGQQGAEQFRVAQGLSFKTLTR